MPTVTIADIQSGIVTIFTQGHLWGWFTLLLVIGVVSSIFGSQEDE